MSMWQIGVIILLVVLFVLYFGLLPWAKKRAYNRQSAAVDQMHAKLNIGDQVVLIDGIVGRIQSLADDEVQIEIAPNVMVTVKRMGIAGVQEKVQNNDKLATVHQDITSAASVK
ncbi:preprotein translocase subunit YajC [Lacticaseibacillus saniviri]|nr:preprotein translocase subunit YajC [Lacticaseibacillus saniviri]MCG4282663.1 preprotein translocase subunit YajC [Lacticaseibacillus saniviri]